MVANTSSTASGRPSASRTACGPSARNSRLSDLNERVASLEAFRTLADRTVRLVGSSGLATRALDVLRSDRSVVLGLVDVGRQVGLRDLDQCGERGRLVDSEFGQVLAVDLDSSGLHALDETVVGQVVRTDSRIDAGNPQATEIAFAGLAVAVRVDQRVRDLFFGLAVEARALTAVARCSLECLPALLMCVY